MPHEFKKLGISFQYPENWELDEGDTRQRNRSVTVYSPGAAFWSVSAHPRGTDPAKLGRAVVKAMREEYEEMECEEVQETVAGRKLVGYDLNFFFLDLTNTARVRSLRTELATYTIFCQAEDRELIQVEPVFLAMTISLLNSLKESTHSG